MFRPDFVQADRFWFFALPRNSFKLCILALSFISLLGTVTNYVPLSAFICSLFFLHPLFLYLAKAQTKFLLSVYFMYVFFMINVFIYAPLSFLHYDFYRRDGNVFIAFLPLLIIGTLSLKIDVEKLTKYFLKWTTCIAAACMAYFLVSHHKNIFVGHNIFFFLFHSHNAAGGFLALSASLALGFFAFEKKGRYLYLLMFLINAGACFLTYSRGSLAALLFAIFIVFVLRERYIFPILLMSVVAMGFLLFWGYKVWLAHPGLAGISGIEEVSEEMPLKMDRASTVVDRVFILWPRAVYLFLQSPIFGTGFGSYNDLPYQLFGVQNVFMLNDSKNILFNSTHAHHSYLHVLCETGLFGLSLLVGVLVRMRRFIISLPSQTLRCGLLLAFWMNVWSSMTEHRLFTPSQMLPFIIILSLSLANFRFEKK